MSKRSLVAISGLLAIALTITLIWGFAEKARFKELTTTFDRIEAERDTLLELPKKIRAKYKIDLAYERNKVNKLSESVAEATLTLRNTKTLNQKRLDVLRASVAPCQDKLDAALYELQVFIKKEEDWNFLNIKKDELIFSLKRQVKLLENKVLDFEGAMARCMTELDSAIAAVNKYKRGGLGFRLFGLNIKVKPVFGYVVNNKGGGFGAGLGITF